MSTNLATEYRQWEFSFELCAAFLEWIGWHQKTPDFVLKDACNILQRWILSLHQDKSHRDPQLPLYPKLDDDNPVNIKFANDLLDKKFVKSIDQSWRIVRKILSKIEMFRSKCYADLNPKVPEVEVIVEKENLTKLIVGQFKTPASVRLHHLVEKFGPEVTATMILRYESAGSGSYQWGDPVSVHRLYYVEFDARYEGFSSPLNSRFFGQANTKFCSIFEDTDAVFGSLGSFFDVDLFQYPGGWTVNPPFIETVLDSAARKVLQGLEAGANCYFFMNFPYWSDCTGWCLLNESRFKKARFDFNPGEFLIQDAYGGSLRPRMKLSIFIVGHLPENCPPVERVRDIVFRERPADYF